MTFRGGELSAADRIDTSVAHPARRYNYLLGGKDNFAADRQSGDALAAAMPTIRLAAVENRLFLQRAVRFLALHGVRQFLDIGTGIPTADNTHEVAQAIDPSARVVYVDNDPIVLAHARALLSSTPEGRTAYLDADLREPERILSHPDLRTTLDLTQPVALMLVAILHFIRDDEAPRSILNRLVAALPSGSYVVASHVTWEYLSPEVTAKLEANNHDGRFQARTTEQFAGLLDGLDLVEPGIVSVARWRADDAPQPRPSVQDVSFNGAVARVR
ncbi:SAM-dependent methyltransferase [Micromonospora sp. STR1_7]|uniref:SAM-dependent methyltransferase n=1 Tax=Micromonospora parastrephiae TaxID=2806101 RepID=A0ABS1XPX5_9ACTN|nr:SAM-dependent methyltransferase [Micromonospora parastrephiae]MBM0231314.1 SAM-dependent methyltransferase [Micromonospora parastrephiae]